MRKKGMSSFAVMHHHATVIEGIQQISLIISEVCLLPLTHTHGPCYRSDQEDAREASTQVEEDSDTAEGRVTHPSLQVCVEEIKALKVFMSIC